MFEFSTRRARVVVLLCLAAVAYVGLGSKAILSASSNFVPIDRAREWIAASLDLRSPALLLQRFAGQAKTRPAIAIDKSEYLVGEAVSIGGFDLAPGELITFQVTHENGDAEPSENHLVFYETASDTGAIDTGWVLGDDFAGHSFLLTASGSVSGRLSPVAFKRVAIVQTDKADYQPGETAIITGAGFRPGEAVDWQVVHIDGTAEGGAGHEHQPPAIAAEDGTFTVTWYVDPDDSLGSILRLTATGTDSGLTATTTFTDADPFLYVNDDGGVNQIDNNAGGQQSDLTRFGIDNTQAGFLRLQWNWDRVDFTSQTGDACAIFDTDGDGKANYSICVRVSNTPIGGVIDPSNSYTTTVEPFFFSCLADSKTDRCGSPAPEPLSTGTDMLTHAGLTDTGTESLVTSLDPFSTGEASPKDTTVLLKIAVADLPLGAKLLNVCSYPSAGNGGNNAPGDCVITPGSGFLTIVKETTESTTEHFSFTLAPAATDGTSLFGIDGGGMVVTRKAVAPGTSYDLNEGLPSNWGLDSASCVLQGASTGTPGSTGVTDFTIAEGQETTCTFTNSPTDRELTIEKTATEATYNAVGDVIHYTIVATNSGNATLPTVTISDPGVGDLTCTPENGSSLAPGDSMTCAAAHTIVQADIDAGHYANTACVDDGAGGAAEVCAEADVDGLAGPAIQVVKTATEASFDAKDDVIHYTLVATNTGNVTLTGVTISDPKLGALTCTQPVTLAPGATLSCTGSYTVTQADVDAGKVDNTGSVTGTPPTGAPVTDTDDESVPAIQSPALNIVKSVTSSGPYDSVGDVITYSITVTNTGNQTLTGVTVTEAGVGAVLGICNPAIPATLAPGAAVVCAATHAVTQGDIDSGSYTNVAMGDSDQTGPDTDDEVVPITQAPAMTIIKTPDAIGDAGFEIHPGGTAEFTITVTNTGNQTLTSVLITDALPSGVGAWTEKTDTLCTITGLDLSCSIAVMPPGTSFPVTVQATIPADYLLVSPPPDGTALEIDGNLTDGSSDGKDWASIGINCTSTPKAGCDLDKPTGKTDDSFGQGTKEDTAVPSIVSGAIPNNKSDLVRFYVATERIQGSDFLYLAWERVQAPKGTTNMDFELNQSTEPSANGITPARTAGDLLIKFDLANGGTVPTLGYHKWVTSASAAGQTPAQACEASQTFPCWGKVQVLTAAVAAAINLGTEVDPIAPNAPRNLTPATFGEAKIDLLATGIFQEDQCVSFGQAYLKSRSSSSFTAEVKDFIAPIPISVSSCPNKDLVNTASVGAANHNTISDGGKITVTRTQP